VKVRLLGTAAGGGLPQWNCACEECARARQDGPGSIPVRAQDGLAVSGDGTGWYLVNASPDIRAQILATPELTPGPGRRETPIRGVLLSSAELDHTLGLVALREGSDLAVYGTAPVLTALGDGFPVRRILEPYGSVSWHVVRPAEPLALDARLWVTAVALGAKRPRYAALADGDAARMDWVVAYRFQDTRTGGAFVYAPCLATWTPAFETAAAGARCVLLDGTCYSNDEMRRRTGTGRTSLQMGHLPIEESLPRLKAYPDTRWLFTHLNNTNPVLTAGSPEHAAVLGAGAEVASDGLTLEL
jgi:pyrroloquinoline quinone biosynthesis protein B